jgi:hypothetical protein
MTVRIICAKPSERNPPGMFDVDQNDDSYLLFAT